MRKRYVYVLAAGIVAFILVGIVGFYAGELMNAPTGVYGDPEPPLEDR
jgi:hypothetical protein